MAEPSGDGNNLRGWKANGDTDLDGWIYGVFSGEVIAKRNLKLEPHYVKYI